MRFGNYTLAEVNWGMETKNEAAIINKSVLKCMLSSKSKETKTKST